MKSLNQIYNLVLESREDLPTQKQVEQYLSKFYPKEAENKLFNDNYGLYSEIPDEQVKKILLCTTATDEVVELFKKEKYDLLISHHDNIVNIPQIIFHSIMDEEATHGHNIYFANRIGLKNIKQKSVIVSGDLYKPLTIDDLLIHLNKHGFNVEGVIHKNSKIQNENVTLSSVIYCSGLGGMLINDRVLRSMGWINDDEFDLRNVNKDVYITGEIIAKKDLDNNKFKYIIELGHTSSEKPLFKWIKNRLLNKWPKLHVDITDNKIDYFGRDKLNG